MIQFENCGARSKILNHYTSHFQRELEQAYGHLLTSDMQCTLCNKDLRNFIKSKVWIHIGVTHDKTNDILIKKGIEPIRVNIRMKRKASDAFRSGLFTGFLLNFLNGNVDMKHGNQNQSLATLKSTILGPTSNQRNSATTF